MRILLCFLLALTACRGSRTFSSGYSLRFIGADTIPYNYQFRNTTVGGLSSIDYDAATNSFYLICDDRSSQNPARFYNFSIPVSLKGVGPVSPRNVHTLLTENGSAFPDAKERPELSVDPEAMRVNSLTGQLVWTSEGERLFKDSVWTLVPPSLKTMDTTGRHHYSFAVDTPYSFYPRNYGLRRNGAFEGMTFLKNYQQLMVSIEEPLYQDGLQAGLGDSAAILRLLRFDVASKKLIGQYFYSCDPVSRSPVEPRDYRINGISDILALDDDRIWIMERAYSTGIESCDVRIYQVHLDQLPKVKPVSSPADFRKTFRKDLVVNLSSLGIRVDNLEGMCIGPLLENGSRSVLMVSDNNFARSQISQVLLFELKKR